MANSVLCTKCGKWVHGRCSKVKKVTSTLAKCFICERYIEAMKGRGKPAKELTFYDHVKLGKSFSYFGDRLKASGESEAAVTARTRTGWIKFRECGELLSGRKPLLKMKRRIRRNCVRSEMLYGGEKWCLR